jgi:hypothetical protein
LTGQLWQHSIQCPGAKIYFNNSDQKVVSDFDGYFSLPLPTIKKDNNTLYIRTINDLSIEIKNIDLSQKEVLELGKIEIPFFKMFEIDHYQQLPDSVKKYYHPIRHYRHLLGYYSTLEVDSGLSIQICDKTIHYDYNSKTKTISVDWTLIERCGPFSEE